MALSLALAGAMCVSSLVVAYQSALKQAWSHLSSMAAIKESELTTWGSSLSADMDLVLPASLTKSLASDILTANPTDPLQKQRTPYFCSLLNRAVSASGHFDEFFLVDQNGRTVASSVEEHVAKASGLPAEMLSGQYAPLTLLLPGLPGQDAPTAYCVRPVVDENGVQRGALAGRVNAVGIRQLMTDRAGLGRTCRTILTDLNLVLITPSALGEKLKAGSVVDTEGANMAKASRQNGRETYMDATGQTVVGVIK